LIAWVRCRISNSRTRKIIAVPCVSSLFTGTKRPIGDARIACRVTHGGADRGFTDRLSICRVVFLALDQRLDVSRRDQPNVMTQLADLAAPKVGSAASFYRHDTRGQLVEEIQHLRPPQLLTQHRVTSAIRSMNLKHILCQPIGDCFAFACLPTDRAQP
jgi:hypothetical protein